MEKAIYVHGTDESEQERLEVLNQMTNKSFIDFLELEETNHVLEVGSGLGILAEEVAKIVSRGKVFGIEYSREQLLIAERKSLANLLFIPGDAHELPFEDNCFDVVYCRYVLEHVKNPLQVLKEMYRVLKPNGKAFVQENNILVNVIYPVCRNFDYVWEKFSILQNKIGGDALIGKRLFPLFKSSGFKNIELSIAPEVHYFGKPTFRPWIENLVGNIRSGQEQMKEHNLITQEDINMAITELKNLIACDDGSAFFYWNRATGVK